MMAKAVEFNPETDFEVKIGFDFMLYYVRELLSFDAAGERFLAGERAALLRMIAATVAGGYMVGRYIDAFSWLDANTQKGPKSTKSDLQITRELIDQFRYGK
jgi:hypothetical protein